MYRGINGFFAVPLFEKDTIEALIHAWRRVRSREIAERLNLSEIMQISLELKLI